MLYQFTRKLSAWVVVAALALPLVLGVSPALAAQDRFPPTRPGNLRVTGATSYSVSLAWNPSTDNSGVFSYVIHASNGRNVSVGQEATSYTWTEGVEAGMRLSFSMIAVDGSGNRSRSSNTVSVITPLDTIPPTAPTLSVTEVRASAVSLTWTGSTDDGPFIFYRVLVNGSPATGLSQDTSATITGLSPATTYTFTVEARDNGINWSGPSNAVTVTTQPADAGDTTPPTTPGSLTVFDGGCGEGWLNWTASTDNVDPQGDIRYEIYVNGTFRPESSTVGYPNTIASAPAAGSTTFEVVAVDSAGNRSAPASVTEQMSPPC